MRWPWQRKPAAEAETDPQCRCGHRKSKHGLMGFPDCTDGEGDLICLCEAFEPAR